MDDSWQLLGEIAHCPIAKSIRSGASLDSPCHKIVCLQAGSSFQVPEPWSGRIDSAPILFISSNPSIDREEKYPDESWEDSKAIDFFQERFTSPDGWVINGRALLRTGLRSRGVSYWGHARNRTGEILQRKIKPGIDFALTEVVHCKSRKEQGVPEALNFCIERYLQRVLSISAARVLIIYGKHAKDAVRRRYASLMVPQPHGLSLASIGDIQRMLVFLPAPNERGSLKKLKANVGDEGLSMIRAHLETGCPTSHF